VIGWMEEEQKIRLEFLIKSRVQIERKNVGR
jgi:hypothetical protein